MRRTLRLTHADGGGTWPAERGLHLLLQLHAAPLNVLRPCLTPSKTPGDTGRLNRLGGEGRPERLAGWEQVRVGRSIELKNHNQSRNKHFIFHVGAA